MSREIDEVDDDKKLDLDTDRIINEHTQREMDARGDTLTTSNILRPVARALGNLAASLNVPLSTVLIEVASAYDSFMGKVANRTRRAQRRPAKRAAEPKTCTVSSEYYRMEVPRTVVPSLVAANLVHPCGCGDYHATLEEHAGELEHEAHRARVTEFIQLRFN